MTKIEMKSKGAASHSSVTKHRRLLAAASVLLICCLAFVGAAGADEYTAVNGLIYNISSETDVEVTDGKACTGDIVIPEKVTIEGKEYAVTKIAANAFNDANEVTSVVIPNSVTTLGGAAFANMDKLTSITIANGVTTWGSKLAVNNYELTTVVISEGATLIGDLAFRSCPKLVSVTLPSSLQKIGATAFAYSSIEELTIPASVTTIGNDAFKGIDTLKTVTFTSVPTHFGNTVFQQCDGLETVVLPDGLTSIPQGTFRYCTSLKNINFPESLSEIGNYAFQGCTSLESVTISKGITNLVTNAFNGCTSLKSLIIENGFSGTIGGYVFQGCTALESVVIPSSMETVGESMFNGCTSLKSVTLSEGVKTLNINAFNGCTSLKYLAIPDSMERMRHGSIANCNNLCTLIIVGDNLPVIEHSNAFDGLQDISVIYNGNGEFTGNWDALNGEKKKGYVIIFDTDGGSGFSANTQDSGTAITAPDNPTKDGYTFAGWDSEIPTTMPNENIVIRAQWTINQYTITFNTDGGSEISEITQDYGTAITAPDDPIKEGYTFNGWQPEIPKTIPAEDMATTAQWTINQYTITFDTDGGSAVDPITQDYGTAVTAPDDPTKEGYIFKGWDPEIPVTMPAEDITVKALWEMIPVSSSAGGGSSGGNYFSYSRTTQNGGLVDFGSSKVIKELTLPEGSSGSVVVTLESIDHFPEELETEYTFDISVEKLGEGMAYIHFEIPLSNLENLGLTPADICAYNLVDNVWVKLTTAYEVKDGTIFYEAETDSFSPFKLVIEEGAATQKAEETEPVIPPTEEPEDKTQEELPPIEPPVQPTEPESPSPILAVFAGLGAAAVLRRK